LTGIRPSIAPFRREQVGHMDAEYLDQETDVGVRRNATPRLNVGDNLRGDVTTQQLEFGGQFLLRPIPLVAEPDHIGSDDIEAAHDDTPHPPTSPVEFNEALCAQLNI